MNWIDLVIVVAFLFYFLDGVRRGFFDQIFELVGFILTIFLTFLIYQPAADILSGYLDPQVRERTAQPLAFLIVWVLLQVLYSVFLRLVTRFIPKEIRNAAVSRWAGLVPAFFRCLIIVSVLLTIIINMPISKELREEINSSYFGNRIINNSSLVEQTLSRILGHDIKNGITFRTLPPATEEIVAPNERVELKFSVSDGTVDRQSEQRMLELINEERVKAGLKPLIWSEKVAETARKHSNDMFQKGYFSHTNLEGLSPFDRMQRDGITFKVAGENIAYAANVELAHSGLMRSPGHRANILEEDFGTVGIGIIDGGAYGKMFTQNFTD